MPLFEYQALDAKGAGVSGQMNAESRGAVIARLQEMGHLPIEARELSGPAASGKAGGGLFARRVPRQDITEFFRELALLVTAGYQLDQAIGVLAETAANAKFAAVLEAIKERIRTGESLSAALERHDDVFSPLEVGMVRAGEASGTLEAILTRVAEHREAAAQLRETVAGALYYPAIVMTAASLAIILLLTFVVPQFEQLFKDAHASLPGPTRFVIGVGHFMRDWSWLLLAGLVALAAAGGRALRRPDVRRDVDRLLLRLPLIRPLVQAAVTARLFQTLGMLLKNGLELPAALRLAKDSAANAAVAAAIDRVILDVREGRSVAERLGREGLFPKLAVGILRIGEESGNLAPAAVHIAEYYGRRLQVYVKRLLTLLEPTLILLVGLVVGGIIFSIIIAVINLNELAR